MKHILPIFKKFWFWGITVGVVILIATCVFLTTVNRSNAINKFSNDKITNSSKKIEKSSSTSSINHSSTTKNVAVSPSSSSNSDDTISTSTNSSTSSMTAATTNSVPTTDYATEKQLPPPSKTSSQTSQSTHPTNDDGNSNHAVQHMVSEGYVLVNSTTGQYYSEIKSGLELPSIYLYMTKKEADSKGYHKASVNTEYEIYIPELSEAPTYEERTSQTSSAVQ